MPNWEQRLTSRRVGFLTKIWKSVLGLYKRLVAEVNQHCVFPGVVLMILSSCVWRQVDYFTVGDVSE
jgi:hypothetical protein